MRETRHRSPLLFPGIALLVLLGVLVAGFLYLHQTNAHAAPAATGPVNKTWYFAEGRVGTGFREYLTIDNPAAGSTCSANITYYSLAANATTAQTKTVVVPIPAASRVTQAVNADLATPDSATTALSVSAMVTVDKSTPACAGFVVERPIYFTGFHGISSGTDVLGANKLGTTFYFADVPGGTSTLSYLSFLNPGKTVAAITVNYFAAGAKAGTQTLNLAAGSPGSLSPAALNLPAHVGAVVTSSQPILAERPTYFLNANGLSGAANVVGIQAPGKDWLFAEGFASATSKETLTIANLDPKVSSSVTVTLKSASGATHPVVVTVAAQSQMIFDVNGNDTFTGATPEVSAEVVATTGNGVVVQREMYYQYHHTLPNGTLQTGSITDVVGLPASAVTNIYNFAEGYTRTNYNEWLTIQNPSAKAEMIAVTVVNGKAKSFTQNYTAPANGRLTVDITTLMQQLQITSMDNQGNSISMTVQTLNNGGNFIAERPFYFNTAGSTFSVSGGTDIIGF